MSGAEQQPLGVRHRSRRGRGSGRRSRRAPGFGPRARSAAPARGRAGTGRCGAGRTASASSGKVRSSTPVVSRKRHDRASPSVSTRTASWSRRRPSATARRSTRRSSRAGGVPAERRARPAARPRARCGATARDGGSAARSTTPSSTRSQPPSGRGCGAVGSVAWTAAELVQPPTQQRRRHDRGHEHDEQQRGVQVAAEDALVEADGGEDQPDLAAGNHADPDEPLVAG